MCLIPVHSLKTQKTSGKLQQIIYESVNIKLELHHSGKVQVLTIEFSR